MYIASMLTQDKGVGNMTKYIKKLVYVLAACVLIAFANALLFWLELVSLIMPNYVGSDALIFIAGPMFYIMSAANFIISVCAYAYVGMKVRETNNIIFEIIMLFVPFLIACPGLIIIHCETFGGWEYIAWTFLSSWGTLIASLHNAVFKYIIAIFPSVCMSIGYIIKVVHEHQRGKIPNKN